MDIFSIDLTHNEVIFIRQSLELPTISGKDAKFLANLQNKLENELIQIEQMKIKEEADKVKSLQEVIEANKVKNIKK
jgi:acid phosphatase family membrane protein YuiD